MPSEGIKMLEFNKYQKPDKPPFIIYAELECIIEKIDRCKNNPENLSTTKASDLKYCHLKAQKISMIYTEVKIA